VQWASIEILCACIVTNAAFYYALLKDWQRGHDSRAGLYGTSQVEQDEFYMQSLPSVSIQDNEPGEPMRIINSGRRLAVGR
jgi:hypothetical protein